MLCLCPDRILAGNAAVKSGAARSNGMSLQGHQQQRLICGNEHDPDRGFTWNPEEGRSKPCDAGKEGEVHHA